MHRIAPFALLAALLATAGPGLAAMEAVAEVSALLASNVNTGLATGTLALLAAQEEAAPVMDAVAAHTEALQQASVLVQVAASNVIFLKNEGEAMAIGAANAAAADPTSQWTLVRGLAQNEWEAAWAYGDMGAAIAENSYETVEAVAAMEFGAFAGAPEAALACAASARPLACAEDFVHSIVEA